MVSRVLLGLMLHLAALKKLRLDDLRLRYWTIGGALTELPFMFKNMFVH